MWSLATLCQGFARGFASLFSFRLATGAFEAPAYPINNRIVTSWFPDQERASAIAMYTSGQFIGLAFLNSCFGNASVLHRMERIIYCYWHHRFGVGIDMVSFLPRSAGTSARESG